MKKRIFLSLILLWALALRIYNVNWDQSSHLHPDERMIVMVAERLSINSLNPKFFAYGSLPLYLLKFVSWAISPLFGKQWMSYDYLPILGRLISALFDVGTLILILKIGERIFSPPAGGLAAFFYATCVFPIQASHFYAVDVMLNFFIWLSIWKLLQFYRSPNLKNALVNGIAFGLALATKVSATVLVVGIGTALLVDLVLLLLKRKGSQELFLKIGKRVFLFGGIVFLGTLVTFIIFEPYALADFPTFWRQINEQHRMTKDAYFFPYTLQYVGTTPYLYHLRNMVIWGMGWSLGLVSVLGCVWYLIDLGRRVFTKGDYDREAQELIVVAFALAYFLTVGRFAVKFMRYLLPLYPFFILTSSYFIMKFTKTIKVIKFIIFVPHLFWLFSFLSIYSRPHSRVSASRWINENIPSGSFLAVEHWDDQLPLFGGEKYQFLEMPMYENDEAVWKWEKVNSNLQKADYIILASNRLYVPLQKLTDCQKYKICYPQTAKYYQDLFSGKAGFKKVAEFSSYPKLEIGNWKLEIDDSLADESFTVYDHPKVVIFKKEEG